MRDVWHRIEAALERIHAGLARNLNPPATEAALAQAEAALGVALPEDYRASALVHDGVRLYLVQSYRILSIADVVRTWRMLDSFVADGTLKLGDSDWVRTTGPVRAQKWNRRWIPVADNGGGDGKALDLDPPTGGTLGQLISQSRDVEAVRVLAPSFRAYLEGFADDLEQGRYEAGFEDGVLVEFRTIETST
jgi:cell wall assembly regulator SMI1